MPGRFVNVPFKAWMVPPVPKSPYGIDLPSSRPVPSGHVVVNGAMQKIENRRVSYRYEPYASSLSDSRIWTVSFDAQAAKAGKLQ
jgi:hypothetical protein